MDAYLGLFGKSGVDLPEEAKSSEKALLEFMRNKFNLEGEIYK